MISEGAYKKFVRVFDTMGSFFGLVALILGLFSLLCDQYDLEFELEGELKEVMDGFREFYDDMKSVVDAVQKIIEELDFKMTCEAIYKVIGGGALVGLGLSVIPGVILTLSHSHIITIL